MSRSKTGRDSALIMFSGGLDSAVTLYWALDRKYFVETVTFDYFHRSPKERNASDQIAKLTGTNQYRIDVSFLKEVEDINEGKKNPGLRRAPSAYIPSRNVVLYGIATSIAETVGARYVVGGHNKDDTSTFHDSSTKFFQKFNETTAIGLYTGSETGRVVLPLSKLTKTQVVILGAKLGVPFEHTWSCYKSGKLPCKKCRSCLLREKAFREAGLSDPLL